MSSESYHEPNEMLSETTKDMHRAIVSLKEELDAIDWYQQRAEVCSDAELRAILLHNKDEETEHAMMLLEWLRRRSPAFATNIGIYLNTSGPIAEGERETDSYGHVAKAGSQPGISLGIGSLKEVK